MRAWEMGDLSVDEGLRMVKRPIPQPGPGELLIKVHATGINARDLFFLSRKDTPRHIPLSDNAGTVAGWGAGVQGFSIGERVTVNHYAEWTAGDWDEDYERHDIGDTHDGFLAEYALAPAAAAVKLGTVLSDEEAATLSTAGLTAWRSLAIEANAQPSETILTLGTGGVSVFGLQVAKLFSAQVIITSSSDEKLEAMKQLGADHGVNYRTHVDWPAEVMRLTGGRGADVVLNNVGYAEIENCFRAVANNARCIHIGAGGRSMQMQALQNLFVKGCSIKGVANGSRAMLADFVRAVEFHRLKPVVHRVFAFEQAREAIELMRTSERIGKLVVKVSERVS